MLFHFKVHSIVFIIADIPVTLCLVGRPYEEKMWNMNFSKERSASILHPKTLVNFYQAARCHILLYSPPFALHFARVRHRRH